MLKTIISRLLTSATKDAKKNVVIFFVARFSLPETLYAYGKAMRALDDSKRLPMLRHIFNLMVTQFVGMDALGTYVWYNSIKNFDGDTLLVNGPACAPVDEGKI